MSDSSLEALETAASEAVFVWDNYGSIGPKSRPMTDLRAALKARGKYPPPRPITVMGRYRTGERPRIGDRVRAHGYAVGDSDRNCHHDEPKEFTVAVIWQGDSDFASLSDNDKDTCGWYAARFDLIGRADAGGN